MACVRTEIKSAALTNRRTPVMTKALMMLAAATVLFAPHAGATELASADELKLTVEDALNVGAGSAQLTSFETVDKDGKPARGFYKFSADVRYAISVNIDISRRVQSLLQSAQNDLIMQMSDGAGKIDEKDDAAKAKFAVEVSKLMKAPSRAGFVRIKYEDLCPEVKEPNCKVANEIPPPVLSLIMPVLQK